MNKLEKIKAPQGTKQRGFTLIELMVVVTIIAILASVAIPSYQDYTVRSRVSEGIVAASAAKVHVLEVYNSGNANGKGYANGYLMPEATRNVESIVIHPGYGNISVTMTEAAGNGTLELVPTDYCAACGGGELHHFLNAENNPITPRRGSIQWFCVAEGNNIGVLNYTHHTERPITDLTKLPLASRYAPPECRSAQR